MAKEQRAHTESMSPAERGLATLQLQEDFFSGLRNCKPYIDALHVEVTGDLFPTAFWSPSLGVHFAVGEVKYKLQIGSNFLDQTNTEKADVSRTLKIDILEPGEYGFGHQRRTRHSVVSVDTEYKVNRSDNSIVEHLHGFLGLTVNQRPTNVDAGDSDSYIELRKLLSPILKPKATEPEDEEAATKVQLGVTGYPGSDMPPLAPMQSKTVYKPNLSDLFKDGEHPDPDVTE